MLELEGKPALLIVDMQNGFIHDEGTFSKMGMNLLPMRDIIPTINTLRTLFTSNNLPVIFTRMAWKEDYSDAGILLSKPPASIVKDLGAFKRGSWDVEVQDDLAPIASDIILDKTRNSAFYSTDLEEQLQNLGVKHLIVTGVGTNVCVESTVRDAFSIGFFVTTVTDATATNDEKQHKASLANFEWFGGTASSEEVEAAVKALKDS